MSRLESLEELLKKDRKSQREQHYIQNTRDITDHINRYGIKHPPLSERYCEVRIVR